ncbi:hypothetical protein QE152_g10774 [Popillia japonica]|uniref:Uncharacterized protein n=1 Tax=Popillia japonica TaxID=7064 RepID=A0AAW1LQ64_POPJA
MELHAFWIIMGTTTHTEPNGLHIIQNRDQCTILYGCRPEYNYNGLFPIKTKGHNFNGGILRQQRELHEVWKVDPIRQQRRQSIAATTSRTHKHSNSDIRQVNPIKHQRRQSMAATNIARAHKHSNSDIRQVNPIKQQ